MSTKLTSDVVKTQAAMLGFDLCGVAAAEPFPELAFLREWIDRGYAGDMGWMVRTAEHRANLQAVVPGAQSVVVTGTLYNTDRPDSTTLPPEVARISRYAWGDDYHEVVKARLDALLGWMRTSVPEPFDARAYVDTGPVQERVFAQYAGLGWIGKNTCLINPELGSWLFLAVIVSTLPLEPDTRGSRAVRLLRPLSGGVPDGRAGGAGCARLHAVHLLPHHRAPRQPARHVEAEHGHARVRVRHLSGGVPVQPAATGLRRRGVAAASGARPAAARGPVAPHRRWASRAGDGAAR